MCYVAYAFPYFSRSRDNVSPKKVYESDFESQRTSIAESIAELVSEKLDDTLSSHVYGSTLRKLPSQGDIQEESSSNRDPGSSIHSNNKASTEDHGYLEDFESESVPSEYSSKRRSITPQEAKRRHSNLNAREKAQHNSSDREKARHNTSDNNGPARNRSQDSFLTGEDVLKQLYRFRVPKANDTYFSMEKLSSRIWFNLIRTEGN